MYVGKIFPSRLKSDPSLWLLIASNGLTIYFALTESWGLLPLMAVYWSQSVIIGFFNFLRLLMLENFSTEGFTVNGHSVSPTKKTKVYTAFFFAFHYGFFHVGYLIFMFIFLLSGERAVGGGAEVSILALGLTISLFFINHGFSYFYNRAEDARKRSNIGSVMSYPYIRIIPMHLTIIFGGMFLSTENGASPLLLFLLLKSFADIVMHIAEHSVKKITTNA